MSNMSERKEPVEADDMGLLDAIGIVVDHAEEFNNEAHPSGAAFVGGCSVCNGRRGAALPEDVGRYGRCFFCEAVAKVNAFLKESHESRETSTKAPHIDQALAEYATSEQERSPWQRLAADGEPTLYGVPVSLCERSGFAIDLTPPKPPRPEPTDEQRYAMDIIGQLVLNPKRIGKDRIE